VKKHTRAAMGIAAATAAITLAATGTAYAAVPTDTTALRNAVTADGIMQQLAGLQAVADANGGTRASGTPGYDESLEFVQTQLEAVGYEVTVQPFLFNSFRELSDPVFEQVSPEVKSASGFRVQVEGPPLLVIVCTPLSAHVRLNDASVTVTGSLKATDRLASSATSPAPSAGVVELTLGA